MSTIFTPTQMQEVITEVEHSIEVKVNAVVWKVLGIVSIPLVLFAVAWGSLYMQVQNTANIVNTQVLTVKDKENLENQIAAVNENIGLVRSDIQQLRRDLQK